MLAVSLAVAPPFATIRLHSERLPLWHHHGGCNFYTSLKVFELSETGRNMSFFCEVIAMQPDTDGSEEHTDPVFRVPTLGSTCGSDSG